MKNKTKKNDARLAIITTVVWVLGIAAGLGWMMNFADAPTVAADIKTSSNYESRR